MHEKGLDLERAVKNPIVNPGRMSVSEDPEYWRHTVLVQKSVTISETVRWNISSTPFIFDIPAGV